MNSNIESSSRPVTTNRQLLSTDRRDFDCNFLPRKNFASNDNIPPTRSLIWRYVIKGLALVLVVILFHVAVRSHSNSVNLSHVHVWYPDLVLYSSSYNIEFTYPPEISPAINRWRLQIGTYLVLANANKWREWAASHHVNLTISPVILRGILYYSVSVRDLFRRDAELLIPIIESVSGESPILIKQST